MEDIRLVSGGSVPDLARAVAANLGVPLAGVQVGRFSDGEVRVEVHESVRDRDVYVVQSLCKPVNENLMELLVIVDALKRASAGRICAVVPYYGYGRQDRKVNPRDPISARLVADLLTTAGVNHMLVVDLHAGQIEGFFDIPVNHLTAMHVIVQYFLSAGVRGTGTVVVTPDIGGTARARAYAKELGTPIAIVDKRRPAPNVSEVLNIVGDVEGKTAVVVDDIIDTAGTVVNCARALKESGAKAVHVACTHPVFSGRAVERLTTAVEEGSIEEVVVTDTIPVAEGLSWVKVLTVAGMLAEAIRRLHLGESISEMFQP